VLGVLLLYPFGHHQSTGARLGLNQQPVNGEVTAAASALCPAQQGAKTSVKDCLSVAVRLKDGAAASRIIHEFVPLEPSTPRFAVGDKVVLAYTGGNPADDGSYQVVDFQRGTPLVVLAVLFAAAVLLLGRWQGVATLGSLGLSLLVLIFFVLPTIVAGKNPIAVGVVGASLIMFVVLYITHGLSARTSTAVLGTLASLALIGGLGTAFTFATKLTGLDEETANLMSVLGRGVDAKGLLLAGLMIGAIGVLDDVTVTQTSAVWELRRANPALGWRELYSAGLRIGRDHASSAVNTLAMAYVGAALPLLLASSVSGRNFADVITSQALAQEVVRTLVGSIGLIASVPITTALAATVASQEPALRAGIAGPYTPAKLTRATGPATNRAVSGPTPRPRPALESHSNDAGQHQRTTAPPRIAAPPEREPFPRPGTTPAPLREDAPATRRTPIPGSNPRIIPPRPLPPREPAPPPPEPRFPIHRRPPGPRYPGEPGHPDPYQR
jgi:uncharacterized membrane protein